MLALRKVCHGMELGFSWAGKDVLLLEAGEVFSSKSGLNLGLLWDRALAFADCVTAI